MTITTRQDFADHCLRQLGGGVVNVELSADQIEDAIQLAIEYYHEFHFDALERDFISYKVTGTKLTVANVAGFSVGDTITTTQGAKATINSISGSIITTNYNEGTVFANTQTITNGTASTTISTVVLGDVDKRYLTMNDSVVNVLKVINYSAMASGADALFSVNFQMASPEILRMVQQGAGATGGLGYYFGMMNYLAEMEFILGKQKSFRFNRRVNQLFLDIGWSTNVKVDDFIILEVYRTFDPESYKEIYNDMWLKKYATALMKKTLGTNLKKYSGMTLPGGLTYNGQQMYDEAVSEIKELEQDLIELQPPVEFYVG